MSEKPKNDITQAEIPTYLQVHVEDLLKERERLLRMYQAHTPRDFIDAQPESDDLRRMNQTLGQIKKVFNRTEQEKKLHAFYEQMRKRFGENFYGIEEVRNAFSDYNRSPIPSRQLIAFDVDRGQEVLQSLHDKFSEPDIQEFLKKCDDGSVDLSQFSLVLDMPALDDGKLISIASISRMYNFPSFDGVMDTLFEFETGGLFMNHDWLNAKSKNSQPEWRMVSNQIIPETIGKSDHDQEDIIQNKANGIGLNPRLINRRTPLQAVYEILLATEKKGEAVEQETAERFFVKQFTDSVGVRLRGKEGILFSPMMGHEIEGQGMRLSR